MAILSASELTSSREALEAGVDGVSEPHTESAIAVAEALLNRTLGYRVANDATSIVVNSGDNERLSIPERIRTISSITDAPFGGSAGSVESTLYQLRADGFSVFRTGGWYANHVVTITGTFGFGATEDEYILAKQFVTIAAVRYLSNTSTDSAYPTPSAGALLTGIQSEEVTFTFFTPQEAEEGSTGWRDLDILADAIGRHPNKKPAGLYTISTTRGGSDITPDQIFAGVPEIDSY